MNPPPRLSPFYPELGLAEFPAKKTDGNLVGFEGLDVTATPLIVPPFSSFLIYRGIMVSIVSPFL